MSAPQGVSAWPEHLTRIWLNMLLLTKSATSILPPISIVCSDQYRQKTSTFRFVGATPQLDEVNKRASVDDLLIPPYVVNSPFSLQHSVTLSDGAALMLQARPLWRCLKQLGRGKRGCSATSLRRCSLLPRMPLRKTTCD